MKFLDLLIMANILILSAFFYFEDFAHIGYLGVAKFFIVQVFLGALYMLTRKLPV